MSLPICSGGLEFRILAKHETPSVYAETDRAGSLHSFVISLGMK